MPSCFSGALTRPAYLPPLPTVSGSLRLPLANISPPLTPFSLDFSCHLRPNSPYLALAVLRLSLIQRRASRVPLLRLPGEPLVPPVRRPSSRFFRRLVCATFLSPRSSSPCLLALCCFSSFPLRARSRHFLLTALGSRGICIPVVPPIFPLPLVL